ncbi:MAG: family 10 glycosylhydrolase [Planctomycetes bacterium]|nr:family 10 glycosylhydrolase [Planctomycetota bacterium]
MKPAALCLLILALGLTACAGGDHATDRQRSARPPRPRPETPARPAAEPRPVGIRHATTRAVWVDAWGSGFESEASCDRLIDWCLERGLNTIIVQMRRTGDAFYPSAIEPRGRIAGLATSDDFDPLDYLVREARDRHGLRLEAWLVANRLWQSDASPAASEPTHLLQAHPDWLLIDREGKSRSSGPEAASYLDPALPEVRAHLARVAADLARRYRVDAIHLDYIRYPDRDWGYGKASLERFRRDRGRVDFPAVGDPDFIAWRTHQVELTVAEIRAALRLASPACELGAAVVVWGDAPAGDFSSSAGCRSAFQDWPAWCRKGLLDLVYPMHYRRQDEPGQAAAFRDWLAVLASLDRGRARLVIGLGGYLNEPAGLGAQIEAVDRLRDADGYALFSYRHPRR